MQADTEGLLGGRAEEEKGMKENRVSGLACDLWGRGARERERSGHHGIVSAVTGFSSHTYVGPTEQCVQRESGQESQLGVVF